MEFPALVSDFPFEKEQVVEVSSTDSVGTAIELLLKNNILSVPVYDTSKEQYLGWFNIVDLLPVFISLDDHIKDLPSASLTTGEALRLSQKFPVTLQDSKYFIGSNTTLGECFHVSISPLFPWKPFVTTDAMEAVIRSLNSDNVKRVPILDPNTGKVLKIISQSAIIQHVDGNIREHVKQLRGSLGINQIGTDLAVLPVIFDKTVADLGFLKEVFFVTENDPVRKALEIMVETKRTAIAILDEEGKLFSCITTKDILSFKSLENIALNRLKCEKDIRDMDEALSQPGLEGLDAESISSISSAARALADLSVTDFISHVRVEALRRNPKGKAKASAITVRAQSTLRRVIGRMSKSKVHRVFVVDELRRPCGVVSVRDVVGVLFNKSNLS